MGKPSRQEAASLIAMLAMLLVGLSLPERITVSTSPSLQHRVFFLSKVTSLERIRTGDYLVFTISNPEYIRQGVRGKERKLIKMVGCRPGQRLTSSAGSFFCNGKLLGKTLATDGKGNALPQFVFSGQVPANKFFMIGQHDRSYDSRYLGFIDAHDILFKASPLW